MTTAYLFAGYPASGKSTALKEAYRNGLYTIETSEVVRDVFHEQTEDHVNDDKLGEWAAEEREILGEGIMADHVINVIRNNNISKNVAVSGIRSPAELRRFQSYSGFDEVVVIGIRADEVTRYDRLNERDNINKEYFDSRNRREEEWGLEKLLNRETDYIIRNESCTELRFQQKISQIVEV